MLGFVPQPNLRKNGRIIIKIGISLETDVALNFELEQMIEVIISKDAKRLTWSDASPLQLNLFNPVYEAAFNNLAKDFALYLDKKDTIQWWHRIAARQGYYLQGWRRDRVYHQLPHIHSV